MRKRTLFTDVRHSDGTSKNNASMNGETSVTEFPVALCFLFMFLSCHTYKGVSSPQGFLGALHSPACLDWCLWPQRGLCCSRLPSTTAPLHLSSMRCSSQAADDGARRDAEGQGKGTLTKHGHKCGLFSLGKLAEKRNKSKIQTFIRANDSCAQVSPPGRG